MSGVAEGSSLDSRYIEDQLAPEVIRRQVWTRTFKMCTVRNACRTSRQHDYVGKLWGDTGQCTATQLWFVYRAQGRTKWAPLAIGQPRPLRALDEVS